ncbi:MAG: sigma-70 family RNA polymerase sigma factor [Cyclobacteriaceae bacterium]|nr:sigma-70 family RNA polymerase sigma factor [Cyclobacteriaceae bacterium]
MELHEKGLKSSVRNSSFRSEFSAYYRELYALAHQKLRFENQLNTLDTSALVHEAFLKMDSANIDFQNRDHFLAIAAIVMRRFLVDYARQKTRLKRGRDVMILSYGSIQHAVNTSPEEILELNDALIQLKKINNRFCRVVEFHFFGGYTYEEIAKMLGVSPQTVRRDWRLAKAWLSNEMKT